MSHNAIAASWIRRERARADAWAARALPHPEDVDHITDVDVAATTVVRCYDTPGDLPMSGATLAAAVSRRIRAHRGE